MEKSNIKRNYLYNLVYQVLILILPIITTPYISRVLGAEMIGIYSYTTSIITYFNLFGTLGISLYGQREIAYIRDDYEKRTKIFWEIISIKLVTMFIAIVAYCIILLRNNIYQQYYTILLINLFATIFDISWFFQGLEEFKKTVSRNVIVRLLSVALIFICVKNNSDLYKYLLIYSLADFIGNVSLWFYLPKYINGFEIKHLNVKKHIVPIVLLFIPQISNKIYNVMDKTMLGAILTDKAELGNYEESYKIINVLYTIVSSIGIVMVPRIANTFAKGAKEELKKYLINSFNLVFFLAFPMILGINVIAKEFVPIFLGKEFEKTVYIIYYLSFMILFAGITNVIGIQYLLPTKRQKEYSISILAGLTINFILNILLIKKYLSIGASIATVISQFIIAMVQMIYIKDILRPKEIVKLSYNFFKASIIMFILCFMLNFIIKNGTILLIGKIFCGIISYIMALIILKDDFTNTLIMELRTKLSIIKHKLKTLIGHI